MTPPSPSPSSSSRHHRSHNRQSSRSLSKRIRQFIYSIQVRTAWKVAFACVAVLDLQVCFPILYEGWVTAWEELERSKDPDDTTSSPHFPWNNKPKSASENSNGLNDNTCHVFWNQQPSRLIGTLFCFCCMIEAIVRSRQARQEAVDMAALDEFERKLAQLYSSARWRPTDTDLTNLSGDDDDDVDERASEWARKTLRFWTPVISTLLFWGLLLPWWNLTGQDQCGADTAIATIWIIQFCSSFDVAFHFICDEVIKVFWKIALPFPVWQFRKFAKRVRVLLRWLRYFRFAGPLLRMLLKLSDQLRVMLTTWDQAWHLQTERAKRMAQRNILFDDIRRVESLSRCKTALARVPTYIFESFQEEREGTPTRLPPEQVKKLSMKKEEGKKIQTQLEALKHQVRSNSGIFRSSDLYDRIIDLSQELTKTVRKSLWNANLISPQTRFSVAWRIIVTCALLSELSRLCTSYQFYGKLNVNYVDMMQDLLVCRSSHVKENVLTATGRFVQDMIGKVFKIIPSPKEPIVSECITSHAISIVLLRTSVAFEVMIDIVCFLDIFVWFFTGEINPDGVVVPKPFIYRCIIPGTLVQVLDHPTLPKLMPKILSCTGHAAHVVGYSRVIRWLLALIPAIEILLVAPLQSFLFRPLTEEEWYRYTDKIAIIPAISGADIRFAVSHPSFSKYQMDTASSSGALRRPSMVGKNSVGAMLQQVGEEESREAFDEDDESLGSFGDSYRFSYGLNY